MTTEAPTMYPTLRYRDAPAAIAFLKRAFGLEEQVVYCGDNGTVAHAQLTYGPSVLMLGSDRDDDLYGGRAGNGWLYVAVDDVDEHCRRAREAGAEVVREIEDQEYGSRDYTARDLEGNLWSFGTYRPAADAAAG
jgi:uncharacterized glyoxalase superfamily protein PhnB